MTTGNAQRVIAVASGKGGVGKSNVAVNLAVGLAGSGRSVMLLDADLGLANLDILLGIHPLYDLQHVIDGRRELADILVKGPCGIDVVPAASGVSRMAELTAAQHAGLIAAFEELGERAEFLIIDTAAGISDSVVSFSRAASEVVVVVCDEPTSLTDAYALIKVLSRDHGVEHFQILANMVKDAAHGRRLYGKLAAVAGDYLQVGLGYLGAIPRDERLREAVARQAPVITLFPGSAAAVAFRALSERVRCLPPAGRGEDWRGVFDNQDSHPEVLRSVAR